MKSERIAVIDLGTNTFHLLIADTGGAVIQPVYSEKIPVRIGKGGINQGYITDEACERALQTMNYFRQKTGEYNVSSVYATATSAFRNARNGPILANKIEQDTGIHISIISGEREAELIYYGVRDALDIGNENSLIVDIGGGSVEFIIANNNIIAWKRSFEIGGQRLMELFQKSDPITSTEISALENYLSEQLAPLKEALTKFPCDSLVGSSGSFDTLSDIDIHKKGFDFSIETEKEYSLSLPDFQELYEELISKNREARMQIHGMIELRVDMIVVAVVLIRYIIKTYQINHLRVSTYALKEGVLNCIINGHSIT